MPVLAQRENVKRRNLSVKRRVARTSAMLLANVLIGALRVQAAVDAGSTPPSASTTRGPPGRHRQRRQRALVGQWLSGARDVIAWKLDYNRGSEPHTVWGAGECGPMEGAWLTVVFFKMDNSPEEKQLSELTSTSILSGLVGSTSSADATRRPPNLCWIAPRFSNRGTNTSDGRPAKFWEANHLKIGFVHDVVEQSDEGAAVVYMDTDVVARPSGGARSFAQRHSRA